MLKKLDMIFVVKRDLDTRVWCLPIQKFNVWRHVINR